MENKPEFESDLYARLSVPFETEAEARTAMKAFIDGVQELRERYKLPDISIYVFATFKHGDDQIGEATGGMFRGDQMKALLIARNMLDGLLGLVGEAGQDADEGDATPNDIGGNYVN